MSQARYEIAWERAQEKAIQKQRKQEARAYNQRQKSETKSPLQQPKSDTKTKKNQRTKNVIGSEQSERHQIEERISSEMSMSMKTMPKKKNSSTLKKEK